MNNQNFSSSKQPTNFVYDGKKWHNKPALLGFNLTKGKLDKVKEMHDPKYGANYPDPSPADLAFFRAEMAKF